MSIINDLQKIVGENNVLTGQDAEPYLQDWRRRRVGKAQCVVRPGSTEEVASIVKLCGETRTPIVPQGGNTGLVEGSIPNDKGDAIVLSLGRMNKVLEIDTENNTMTVQAGLILENAQKAAEEANRLFPVSLGAKGTCTVGGNLSTNAGGTQVIRFGNTRQNVLGLEVVTAQGKIWHGLEGLYKDNTGLDLRDLYVGSEGTLGVITAATFKLFPQPAAQMTAMLAFSSIKDAIKMLHRGFENFGASMTGFELMSQFCVQGVFDYFPEQKISINVDQPWYGLLELSDVHSAEHAREEFERVIGQALEDDIVKDAVIAESIQQANQLWHIRESIPLVGAKLGGTIHNDISLPISKIAEYVEKTDKLLLDQFPGINLACFGHLGDGNLHYNVCAPQDNADEFFEKHEHDVYRVIFDQLQPYGGSISAEHGVGELKKAFMYDYKSPVALEVMQTIKKALDPNNIMNPGKVLNITSGQ